MRIRRHKPKATKVRNRSPQKSGADCARCPLQNQPLAYPKIPKGRQPALTIVGEGPGKTEIETGRFFAGASGREITRACEALGIDGSRIWYTNATLCRPPAKDLSPAEWKQAIKCCAPRLTKDIKQSRSRVALAVGKQSLKALTGKHQIRDWMGAPLAPLESIQTSTQLQTVVATYHPAFCMRSPSYWIVFDTHFQLAWQIGSAATDLHEKCAPNRQKSGQFGSLTADLPDWPAIWIDPNRKMVAALDQIAKADRIGVDVETAGPSPTAGLTAVGVSTYENAVSCPWPPERFATKAVAKAIRSRLKRILGRKSIEKCAHNGSHDLLALEDAGIPMKGYVWDTLILHATVAPGMPHDLSFVAAVDLPGLARWKSEFRIGASDDKGRIAWESALDSEDRRRDLCTYNAKDCAATLFLANQLIARINDPDQCWNGPEIYRGYFDRSLLALKMRRLGALINEKALEHHKERLGRYQSGALKIVRRICKDVNFAGAKDFNPGSPIQQKALFFDHLKCRVFKRSPQTGQPSLDEKVLQKIVTYYDQSGQHPRPDLVKLARAILKFRKWSKLLSTYVVRLDPKHPKSYADKDWTIHPEPRVIGARTMRWSYKAPNIQTIPALPYDAKDPRSNLRNTIAARPGKLLLEADFSQIEARIGALLAGDKPLLQWYADGRDIHTENARQLFNTDAPTKNERNLAKRFLYAVAYGASPQTIWENLVVDFEGLQLDDIAWLRKRWYQLHPAIESWQSRILKQAQNVDYIELPLSGRRIHFLGAVEPNKVYNYPIQGTAANIIDDAIEKLAAALDWKSEVILFQVHDALICETSVPEQTAEKMLAAMAREVTLGDHTVAFPIDFKIGPTWGDTKDAETPKQVGQIARQMLRSRRDGRKAPTIRIDRHRRRNAIRAS